MRSCNGKRPPLGSEVSVSIVTYITWLSSGQPIRMNPDRPLGPNPLPQVSLAGFKADQNKGAELYLERCASCHGRNGLGRQKNPPLWGEHSYNDGAGLAEVQKLASWLKPSMPPEETDLTDDEALNIAAFINSHDRPKFRLKDHLPEKSKLGEYNSLSDK
jgi:thiosulfate dehydrogenase